MKNRNRSEVGRKRIKGGGGGGGKEGGGERKGRRREKEGGGGGTKGRREGRGKRFELFNFFFCLMLIFL